MWLTRDFGFVGYSTAAAAGIAGLLGDASPQEAITLATTRFRCVSLSTLSYSDFTSSPLLDQNFDLYGRTEMAFHGCCDAFISHSWHDCPTAKWAALQRWRSEFVSRHNREPQVWFDKCCVDQTNIDEDLRCLPIFLNGCSELVVLCGTTYMTRLWCIMELFTFAHMKAEPNRITLIRVPRELSEQGDLEQINHCLEKFDAQRCACFNLEDKERMLSMIVAAFGSLDRFNDVVRKLMSVAGLQSQSV